VPSNSTVAEPDPEAGVVAAVVVAVVASAVGFVAAGSGSSLPQPASARVAATATSEARP
jgi:hypothetical protein